MAEIKRVAPRKSGPDNMTVRNFKLGIRNFVNKYTGQDDLIKEYNDAIMAIARASDESNSPAFKEQALEVLDSVKGGEWVTDGVAMWEQGGFNPYKPMQKKVLRQKIAQLSAAMKTLGISR